jgi:hypothetical protein
VVVGVWEEGVGVGAVVGDLVVWEERVGVGLYPVGALFMKGCEMYSNQPHMF